MANECTLWTKDGKLIKNSDGKLIMSRSCPCGGGGTKCVVVKKVKKSNGRYICSGSSEPADDKDVFVYDYTISLRTEYEGYKLSAGESIVATDFNCDDVYTTTVKYTTYTAETSSSTVPAGRFEVYLDDRDGCSCTSTCFFNSYVSGPLQIRSCEDHAVAVDVFIYKQEIGGAIIFNKTVVANPGSFQNIATINTNNDVYVFEFASYTRNVESCTITSNQITKTLDTAFNSSILFTGVL